MNTLSYFCIVCGREFRPAAPDVVICHACGGPPEAPVTGEPQGTILMDESQVTVPDARVRSQKTVSLIMAGEWRFCIVCGREFYTARMDADKCPSCGGSPETPTTKQPQGTSSETRVEWKIGDLVLQEYRVEQVLGEGGFGKVYLVESERTGAKFAVKRVRLEFQNENLIFEDAYKNLIDELRVWVDLPPFPYVLPCRFFRTIEGEVVIFTDYANAGSLKDWIYERGGTPKLYTGGHDRALQRILDFAIQFAWGLHFLHRLGYVHQDVKPGNALITGEDVLLVSDFGLARTKIKGFSLPYAAPEQNPNVVGQIDRRTDIWCWGVSVLEMFTGEVTWLDGSAAPGALESYLSDPPADLPGMPDQVADILRRCFQYNPDDRWNNALEAAEALRQVYEARFGPFPRSLPSFPERQIQALSRKVEGAQWNDPLPYLRRALESTGGNIAEAEHFATDRSTSLRSQAVSDLACYQEALRVYTRGSIADSALLAELYANQALVQQFLGDFSGALSSFDQGICILEKVVYERGLQEYKPRLAQLYGNKGFQLALNRQYEAAIQLYDKTIDILAPYILEQFWREGLTALIAAYNNKALALDALGRNQEALTTYQQALHFLESLASQTQHPRVLNELAITLSNQAKTLVPMGQYLQALQLCDRAIALQEDLLFRQGQEEIAEDIVSSYTNKAGALYYLGRYDEALLWLDKAIGLYEDLIAQKGQRHLSAVLSQLYVNKANVLKRLHRIAEALAFYDQAIALSEMLVQQEGRWDLAHQHAENYLSKAYFLQSQGQELEALHVVERALSFLERLVQQERRRELSDALAAAYRLKAALVQNQDGTLALQLYDQALQVLESHTTTGNWLLVALYVRIIADKSTLLEKSGRLSEALTMTEKAMQTLEQALQQGAPQSLTQTLADVTCRRAELLRQVRRYRESVQAFDRAIALYQEYLRPKNDEVNIALGKACHDKAFVLDEMGEYTVALQAYDQAIKIFKTLPETPAIFLLLAHAQINKSATLARLGEVGEAISQLKEARQILEKCPDPNAPEVAKEIARACNDQAFALDELRRFNEALPLYDRAIAIRERLLHQHQLYETLPDLIVSYNNKAFALLNLGRSSEAIALCERAIALGEKDWSLDGEPHMRLAKELSVSYHRKATIRANQGRYQEAATLYEKAVRYLEPIVVRQEHWEFCSGLVNVMVNRAFCLFQIGRQNEGRHVIERALEIIDKGLEHHADPKLMMLRQQIQTIR